MKSLYEEALVDAKQLREAAENNAKMAIIEAVAPRIRELVDKQILGESVDETKCDDHDDVVETADPLEDESPQCEGDQCDEAYELTKESVESLMSLSSKKSEKLDEVDSRVKELTEEINMFASAGRLIKRSKRFFSRLDEVLHEVTDMYSRARSVSSCDKQEIVEAKLESLYERVSRLKEMSKRTINEDAVSIKLKGLPEDINVEDLDIEISPADEDESGEEGDEANADDGDDSGEALASDDNDNDNDDGDDDASVGSTDLSKEGVFEMDDDTVIEIDENILKREIMKMKRLREEKLSRSSIGAFGNGTDEGDPWLDGEVTTESVDDEDDEEAAKLENRRVNTKCSRALGEAQVEINKLKRRLNEAGLFNAKLVHANKLLQKEGLSSKQKATVIEQLDRASTVREVKLVYESLCRAMLSKPIVSEQRRIVNTASKSVTSSGAGLINESKDAARWAQLAGIKG